MPDPTIYPLSFQGSVVNELLTKVSVASGTLLTTESDISGSKIQAGSVSASQLATSAVASEHIQDGAVTSLKILDGAVATSKILDGAITGSKIASNAALTIVSLNATSSIAVDSKPVATQEWVNQAINSAILSAINSSY